MAGIAVEQMLELWWRELRQVKAQLRFLFSHPSVAASATAFLDGLLGPERRKTGWMRAEATLMSLGWPTLSRDLYQQHCPACPL